MLTYLYLVIVRRLAFPILEESVVTSYFVIIISLFISFLTSHYCNFGTCINSKLGGLFRGLFWGGGNYPPPPTPTRPLCLKLVRIILETSNYARKYILIYSFRKYTLYYLGPLNSADVSIFCKKLAFFIQRSTFTQGNSMIAVLEIF